jgi:O-antigen/teichoic acid export membrane protein
VELTELRGLTTLLFSHPRQLQEELRRRPVLMLFVANLAAQSISVGISPVLSRLYSPHDFGVLGALNGLVMIALPMTSLRFEFALPRARSDRESLTLLSLCGITITVMSLVVWLVAWLAAERAQLSVLAPLRAYLYFVPLAAFATSAFDTLAMEASRRGQLEPLASSKLTQATLGVGTQLLVGWLRPGAFGLLLGFLISQSAGVTRLFRHFVLGHPTTEKPTWTELKQAAIAQRDYPLYTSWTSSIDACSRWALQLGITMLWDARIGGFIFMADRVLGRPLMLLSTSLLPVFMAEFGRAVQDAPQRLPAIFFATLRRQAIISLGWTLAIVTLAPICFGPLFGPAWRDSVIYVQIMSVAVAPGMTLHPVCFTLQLLGRQRIESVLVMARVVLVSSALIVCYFQHVSALFALTVFALLSLAYTIARFALYVHMVKLAAAQHAPAP